ncbi:MAG: hypothetical protein ACRD16_05690 [Thermoanaerobaculia bacterium]
MRELVENGDFPWYAESLVAFTLEIDQGLYQFKPDREDAKYAPHLAYLAIQNLTPGGRRISPEVCIQRGLDLIRRILGDILKANGTRGIHSSADFLPSSPGATLWTNDPTFDDVKTLLDAEREKFDIDSRIARYIASVALPAADGFGTVEVRAFVSPRPTRSALNKYWVRASGYPLFICPVDDRYDEGAGEASAETVYRRVILSVDPHFSIDGRKVNLRGLGFALEFAERAARRNANDGIDSRGGAPRFGDGYCENADPWYDGRAHGWTIVDSPRAGTVLSYAKICEIALEALFWEIPLEEARVGLIWMDPERQTGRENASFVEAPKEMTATLGPYFQATRSEPLDPSKYEFDIGPGFTLTGEWRHFPAETSPSIKILHVTAGRGATLENLVALRADLSERFTGEPPAYSIARLRMGTHFSSAVQVERLIASLADSDAALVPSADWDGNIILVNGTNLILHQSASRSSPGGVDSSLEVLVYSAFVNESLISFSQRINKLVSRTQRAMSALGAGYLRRAVIRFQACYYELEVSRNAMGRLLFNKLSESLHLVDQYQEVLMELERLRELEEEYFEARRSRAERAFEFVLFIVAVFSSFQTLIAFYTLDASVWRMMSFRASLLALCAAAILVYLGIALYRRLGNASRR